MGPQVPLEGFELLPSSRQMMYSGVTDFLIDTAGFNSTFSGSTAWTRGCAQSAIDGANKVGNLIAAQRIIRHIRRHDIGR